MKTKQILLSIEKAQNIMQEQAESFCPQTETTPLNKANKKITATDIVSPINSPPFDCSAMDGIAVAHHQLQKSLPISQNIFAGMNPESLKANSVARIFTGAKLPQNADSVIPQEDCTITETTATINATVKQGQWVRKKGRDIKIGQIAIKKGTRLNPIQLGLLAGIGISEITSVKNINIKIITTGDEIVPVGQSLKDGEIYNSAATFLGQLLDGWNCTWQQTHILDNPTALEAEIAQASKEFDLIITVGGASVGKADYVKTTINKLGSVIFWGVNVKPGKPFLFGKVNNAFVCGLPGNPVSSLVSSFMLVRPFIQHLQKVVNIKPNFYQGKVDFHLPKNTRAEYRRANVVQTKNGAEIQHIASQDSHLLSVIANANALIIVPANTEVKPNDKLQYILINELINL